MRPKIPEYTTLVMSGGGVRGLALLGALQYLADQNRLSRIQKFIGTSIGAIIGYLIAIGYSPIEIMIQVNQRHMIETFVQSLNIMDLVNHGGAMNYFVLHEILEDMTISKIGHVLTLRQLYDDFGKHLVCCTYNYSRRVCEYLDYHHHPNMPCLTALRMSSSLPFIFHPFTYDGSMYVDGAMMDSFPVSQLHENDVALAIRLGKRRYSPSDMNPTTTTTTTTTTTSSNHHHTGRKHHHHHTSRRAPFQLLSYILQTLFIPIEHLHQLLEETSRYRPRDRIHIELDMDAFNWSLSMAERFDAFSIGYDAIRTYYQPNYIIPVQPQDPSTVPPKNATPPSCSPHRIRDCLKTEFCTDEHAHHSHEKCP